MDGRNKTRTMANNDTDKLESLLNQINIQLPAAVKGAERSFGDAVWNVHAATVLDVLTWLKDRGFNLLLDIDGVDGLHLGREERFEVIYILYSIEENIRLRVKVFLSESNLTLPTATGLWQSANWAEREVFDMFGVIFEGHPNLQRILCHHEFEGHALRKDYPVMKGQWCSSTRDMMKDLEE